MRAPLGKDGVGLNLTAGCRTLGEIDECRPSASRCQDHRAGVRCGGSGNPAINLRDPFARPRTEWDLSRWIHRVLRSGPEGPFAVASAPRRRIARRGGIKSCTATGYSKDLALHYAF